MHESVVRLPETPQNVTYVTVAILKFRFPDTLIMRKDPQWRSSAPKSGGAQTSRKVKSKKKKKKKEKKKKKKKITAVFKRMIGYCE